MNIDRNVLKSLDNDPFQKGFEVDRSYKEKALNLLPEGSHRILDVGCGPGKTTEKIKSRGHEVVGMDLSHTTLKTKKNDKISRVQADFNHLIPFDEDTFSGVWCCDVLEHVLNPLKFLNALNRLIKPNGFLILLVPNSSHLFFRILYLMGYVPRDLQVTTHRHFFSVRSLLNLIEKTNFLVDEIYGRYLYLALKENWFPEVINSFCEKTCSYFNMEKEYSFAWEENIWIKTDFGPLNDPLFSDQLVVQLQKKTK